MTACDMRSMSTVWLNNRPGEGYSYYGFGFCLSISVYGCGHWVGVGELSVAIFPVFSFAMDPDALARVVRQPTRQQPPSSHHHTHILLAALRRPSFHKGFTSASEPSPQRKRETAQLSCAAVIASLIAVRTTVHHCGPTPDPWLGCTRSGTTYSRNFVLRQTLDEYVLTSDLQPRHRVPLPA